MSIQDEINQQKLEMERQSQLRQIERQNGLKEAEKVIPRIAEYVKNIIVRRAAAGQIEKRGLFGRIKYVKVELNFDQDDLDKQEMKWYFIIARYPELCGRLANKLRSLGLSNVTVELWREYRYCLHIYAELAMN